MNQAHRRILYKYLLVLFYDCTTCGAVWRYISIATSNYTLQTRTGGTRLLRPYAQLNIAKITFSIAAYRVGTICRLQWLMPARFRVLNDIHPTLTYHLLYIVHNFNLQKDQRKW